MYELVEYLICRLGLQMLVSNVYICLVDAWLDFELIRVSNGKEKKIWKKERAKSGRILTCPLLFIAASIFVFFYFVILTYLRALVSSGAH